MSNFRYSWDSNIFLAWIGAPVRPDLDKVALDEVVDRITSGGAVLLTSVLVHTEVLKARTAEPSMNQFEQFLQRANVFVHDVNRRVAERAEAIRSACLQLDPARRIKTVDSIFAATAVLRKIDVLHTTDDGLLNLDGHAIVDGLWIALPGPLVAE